MVRVFVRKPDVIDVAEGGVRHRRLGQQRPTVIERGPLQPGVTHHPSPGRLEDERGMIDKIDLHRCPNDDAPNEARRPSVFIDGSGRVFRAESPHPEAVIPAAPLEAWLELSPPKPTPLG